MTKEEIALQLTLKFLENKELLNMLELKMLSPDQPFDGAFAVDLYNNIYNSLKIN